MRKIELGYLKISERAKAYVKEVLDSNRLSAGPFIQRFERAFAQAHGCRHAIFCNSGTSALQIALAALKERHGWADGDEVLVPALTFVATSNIVMQNRMTPVFVDVDPHYYNIDPQQIERHLTPRTRAILPVHLFGQPCDMDPILQIARRHRLAILEDSCETMFARYRGQWVGSFGELACFSTYVAHLLVTGVGGLITASDDALALLCRSLMAHGRDTIYLTIDDDDHWDSAQQLRQMIERRFSFIRMGFSYRATEVEGALGLAALEEKDEMIARRRRNAQRLTELLRRWEDRIQLPRVMPQAEHSFMMYPIVLADGWEREPFLVHLESRGIETRYLMPLLSQPYYRQLFGPSFEDRYPVARRLSRQGFYIGCHQGLTPEDLEYVAEVFSDYFQRSPIPVSR
jgi:perosamine synthetase